MNQIKDYVLKNNTITHDLKLDRVIEFDNQSRNYPITRITTAPIGNYDWECSKTLNQGSEGACVGFGISHELIATPVAIKNINNKTARQLYFEAQRIDNWEGGAYPGANPFYEGTSVLAGVKVAKKMGFFDSYYWAFGINDLITGLATGPAVLGVLWTWAMYNPNRQGFIRPTGQIAGGHCILCRGVNLDQGYFTLRNSWGPSWGDKGDCYMTFSDMNALLDMYGEAVFFINRKIGPGYI